ncbi:MAG: alpha/beta hydrolase [Proteobacteria bacterium]|nr:alpha/beta hydrolase [Pseudomonadota bacterium]
MMELHPTLENRLPDKAEVMALRTGDGLTLRAMKCGSGAGRGTILLMNGRADYLERYFETMRDLVSRGFCVASFDWRGQGGSQRLLDDPMRGHVTSFKYFDEDLRTAMEQLVRAHCPGPYYALAHSTGGHVLLRNIVRDAWFSKCIVTAPLMELNYGAWPRWVARFLSYTFVRGGFSWVRLPGMRRGPMTRDDFDGNPLTSDRDRWIRDMQTLERTPQLGIGSPTMGWLNAAMESIDRMQSVYLPKGPKCPVLMVLAGRDRVVDNTATLGFSKHVPGMSFVMIRDALHEILMERSMIRAEFFAALDSYLDVKPN